MKDVLSRLIAFLTMVVASQTGLAAVRQLEIRGKVTETGDVDRVLAVPGDRYVLRLELDDAVRDTWTVRRDTGLFPNAITWVGLRIDQGTSGIPRRQFIYSHSGDIAIQDRWESIISGGGIRTGEHSSIRFQVSNRDDDYHENPDLWQSVDRLRMSDPMIDWMVRSGSILTPSTPTLLEFVIQHPQRHPFINTVQMRPVPPVEAPLSLALPFPGAAQLLRDFIRDPSNTTSDTLGTAYVRLGIVGPRSTYSILMSPDEIQETTPVASVPSCPWVQASSLLVGNHGSVEVRVGIPGPAPAGGLKVDLLVDGGGVTLDPGFIRIPEGTSEAVASIRVVRSEGSLKRARVSRQIRAVSAMHPTCRPGFQLTVEMDSRPMPLALAFLPEAVTGGNLVIGLLTLDSPAPQDMIYLLRAEQEPIELAGLPSFVTVFEGQTQGVFVTTTGEVSSGVTHAVHATDPDTSDSVLGRVTLQPRRDVPVLDDLVLDPPNVTGGATSTATVVLSSPAPAGGQLVQLSGSSPASVGVSVLVPEGARSASFVVTTVEVTAVEVAVVRAGVGDETLVRHLGVHPVGETVRPVLISLRVNPRVVLNGGDAAGMIELNAPVESQTTVSLSSFSTFIGFPSGVRLDPGERVKAFPVHTARVSREVRAILTASLLGIRRDAVVDLGLSTLPILGSVDVSHPVVEGPFTVRVTVRWDRPAPAGGDVVHVDFEPEPILGDRETFMIAQGQREVSFLKSLPAGPAGGYLARIRASTGVNRVEGSVSVVDPTRRPEVSESMRYADWVSATFSPVEAVDPAISGPGITVPGSELSNLFRYLQWAEPGRPGFLLQRGSPGRGGTGLFLHIDGNPAVEDYVQVIEGSPDLQTWLRVSPGDWHLEDVLGSAAARRATAVLEVVADSPFHYFRIRAFPVVSGE